MKRTFKKLYKVEGIVDKKIEVNGKEMYLVKWEGFSSGKNTWEPKKHLLGDDVKKMISKFEKANPDKKSMLKSKDHEEHKKMKEE